MQPGSEGGKLADCGAHAYANQVRAARLDVPSLQIVVHAVLVSIMKMYLALKPSSLVQACWVLAFMFAPWSNSTVIPTINNEASFVQTAPLRVVSL